LTKRSLGDASSVLADWRSAQTARQLFVVGEPTSGFLRERKSAINLDFERATTGSAKIDVRRGAQFEDQLPRRTGARLISSLAAIFDLDLHGTDLAIQTAAITISKGWRWR
jgi:hypothetical protein